MTAVIFVPALAGSVICGFIFLMFAANYYLTVMESTGVGAKEVTWFSEPILDNAWKVAYLGWLIGLWLGPAYFIGRAATAGMDSVWWKLAIPLAVFWICYPISQLSSLSGDSIWYPLVPDVFVRLLQKPLATLGFLLLSIPVLALFAVGFKWAFLTEGEWMLLFFGAPFMVLAGMLYARLIGRLAFGLRYTKSLFPERRKEKTSPSRGPGRSEEKSVEIFTQPSELPPINTPYDGELSGYDLQLEEKPAPRPKKRLRAEIVEEDEDEPRSSPKPPAGDEDDSGVYGLHDAEPAAEPRRAKPRREIPPIGAIERSRVWTDEDDEDGSVYGVHEAVEVPREQVQKVESKPIEEEMKLLSRDDVPKKPRVLWGPDLLAFLGQPATISAIVVASGLCTLAGAMVRIARLFNPVAGAGDGP